VRNFDFTACCVTLSVSPTTGELQWSVPYLSDIVAGALAPTPFLCNYDMSQRAKRDKTVLRVAKYAARGYCPTAELQHYLIESTPENEKVSVRETLDCATLTYHALKNAK